MVSPVLESLGQNLEYRDKEQAEDWLSSLVAHALIDELRPYPETRPAAERLDLFLAMANDKSAFTPHPKAVIEFGYKPANDKFLFPKEWFTKK